MMWTNGFSPARALTFGSEGRDSGGAVIGSGIMPWILTWWIRLIKAVNGDVHSAAG